MGGRCRKVGAKPFGALARGMAKWLFSCISFPLTKVLTPTFSSAKLFLKTLATVSLAGSDKRPQRVKSRKEETFVKGSRMLSRVSARIYKGSLSAL